MPTGTYTVADLTTITTNAVDFGIDPLRQAIQRDLDNTNIIVNDMMTDLAELTTDRERIYGSSVSGEMLQADEYDRGISVKVSGGSNVGFPLYKFVKDVGWTRDYMLQTTVGQIANTVLAIEEMYVRAIRREMQRAIFGASNYSVLDRFQAPQINLNVKRLVNADSASIPSGPNGETFNAATHTHYDFLDGAAPTLAFLNGLVDDIVEHGHGNRVLININRAAETAVRAMTGFVPYYAAGVDPGANAARGAGTLDTTRQTNRAIGILDGAEVWTRSWVPAGYVFVYDAGTTMRPLVMRQHPVASVRGLRIAAQLDDYPLYAQVMDAYFGFGVWNRTNGAVGYYAGGAVAYVEPTFS